MATLYCNDRVRIGGGHLEDRVQDGAGRIEWRISRTGHWSRVAFIVEGRSRPGTAARDRTENRDTRKDSAEAMFAAGTVAVSWEAETYVVVRAEPFQLIVLFARKLVPLAVRVKPASVAVEVVGLIEVKVGTGFGGRRRHETIADRGLGPCVGVPWILGICVPVVSGRRSEGGLRRVGPLRAGGEGRDCWRHSVRTSHFGMPSRHPSDDIRTDVVRIDGYLYSTDRRSDRWRSISKTGFRMVPVVLLSGESSDGAFGAELRIDREGRSRRGTAARDRIENRDTRKTGRGDVRGGNRGCELGGGDIRRGEGGTVPVNRLFGEGWAIGLRVKGHFRFAVEVVGRKVKVGTGFAAAVMVKV